MFSDADRVVKRVRDDIAPKVAADAAYKNAKENTPHTARVAHDQALNNVMQALLKDDTDVYKQFVENEAFKRFTAVEVLRQAEVKAARAVRLEAQGKNGEALILWREIMGKYFPTS